MNKFVSRLLSSVALPVLLLSSASVASANDACTTVGGILTCSGNQAAGVSATNPITVLRVMNLTSDIASPSLPAGTSGVSLYQTADSATVTC